jgi:N-acetylmuramoyl-L-alanine amidase
MTCKQISPLIFSLVIIANTFAYSLVTNLNISAQSDYLSRVRNTVVSSGRALGFGKSAPMMVNKKYFTTKRKDLANKNSKKFVILHYTSMEVSNKTYGIDQMASHFKKQAETGGDGYVQFTTGSKGEIYQILPDHFKVAGALANIKKNQPANTNAIHIEMHYDPMFEKANDPMLKATAKIVAKYANNPLNVYAHWGIQPWNKPDVEWIRPNGDIDPQLIKFVGYVQDEGAWRGKNPREIAKIITKNNIQNALASYKDPTNFPGKKADGQTSIATLNSGLSRLK